MRLPFMKPRAIAKRTAPVKSQRNYTGALTLARYTDFKASTASADAELMPAIVSLRGRSRNLARNNAHARRFLQLLRDNVVGTAGFQLQVRAKNTNGGTDTAGNDIIEREWRKWCKKCTSDRKMSFAEASKLVTRVWATDGEAFIQKVRNKRYRDSLALHFIEADRLDHTLNTKNKSGNQIRMGVEVNEYEEPVAYWFLTYHPGDTDWNGGVTKSKHVRIPASDIIHVYQKHRPGQSRGEPPMSAVLMEAKMLSGYREAEITNRRISAAKMGFFKRMLGAGPVSGIADSENIDTGALEMDVEPGKFTVLPENYELDRFDPSGSSTDYAQFEKQILRSFSAGLGPSYVDIAMDLEGVSYSSMRQGALADRDFYRGMQQFLIEEFVMPVYEEWLSQAMSFGDVNLPSFRFDKFFDASYFRARGWQWVDPQKEIKAAVMAIENNLTSHSHVAGEQGREFDEVVDEIERDRALIKAKGLIQDGV